jgi:hypothetical protein
MPESGDGSASPLGSEKLSDIATHASARPLQVWPAEGKAALLRFQPSDGELMGIPHRFTIDASGW